MGAKLTRLKQAIKVVVHLLRSREFRLLFDLSSIDHNFYIQATALGRDGLTEPYHPLFDPLYYRRRYLDPSYRGTTFSHFLAEGIDKGYKPGPFFDHDVYRRSSGWKPGEETFLKHYLKSGYQSGRPGNCFDPGWYKDKTPILHRGKIDPVKHYRLHGSSEGKSPIPLFDPDFYQKFMPENETGTDPLCHYLMYGIENDTPPCSLFDPVYYRKQYEIELDKLSPFEHYLLKGAYEGNYCSKRIADLPYKPLISIIVPVYNPDPCFLNNCIRSVLYQQYPHWQLCLADDGSSRKETTKQLLNWQERDERIKVVFMEKNQGISAATNKAAELADGDYLGFLDNDDELAPDCLYYIAERISEESPDVIYTDEDLVGDDGRRFTIFHKPDFNRALLYSHNYITHFVAVSRTLFMNCHGLSPEFDGAQDLDFILRVSDQANKIVHIPKILYHWRSTKTSTSMDHSQKGYAHDAGKRALQGYFDQNCKDVAILDGDRKYTYRVKKVIDDEPSVSVLMWGKTGTEEIRQLENLIDKTDYGNCQFDIVTGCDIKNSDRTTGFETFTGSGMCKVYGKTGVRRSRGLSEIILSSDSDYILFLDSTVFDVDSDWMKELVSQMTLPDAGIVCGRISYPDGDGPSYSLPDLSSESPVYYLQFLTSCSRHLNWLHYQQYLTFVSWDICILRRSDYHRLGGFDYENYPSLFAMTDLALRAAQEGLNTIYNPYAKVYGNQSDIKQGKRDLQNGLSEKKTFQNAWRAILRQGDPYYNHGILDENNIDRDEFMEWFTGGAL